MTDATATARRRARAAAARAARAAKPEPPADTIDDMQAALEANDRAELGIEPAPLDGIAVRAAELDAAYQDYDGKVQAAWRESRRVADAAWETATRQVDAAALEYNRRVSKIRKGWA